MKAKAFANVMVTRGYTLSVSDDEGLILKRSADAAEIAAAIESVEVCTVRIRENERTIGFLAIMVDREGLEVIDHTDNDTMGAIASMVNVCR